MSDQDYCHIFAVNGTTQSTARKRLKLSTSQNEESSENLEEMTFLSPGPVRQEQLSVETPLKDQNTAIDTEPETPLQTVDDVETETPCANFKTPMQAPIAPSEREMLYTELNNVRRERDEALQRIELLEKLVNASSLTSTAVEGNNEQCKMLTGVSWDVFIKIFLFLGTFVGSKQSCPNLPLKPLSHQDSVLTVIPRRPKKMQNAEVRAVRTQASPQQRSGIAIGRGGIA